MRHSQAFAALMQEALETGARVRFRAEGTSMYPTIRHGEMIAVAAVSPCDVVRGDVLLCRRDNRVLAHRVVGMSTNGTQRVFHMRGDAKAACDAPIAAQHVVGRVISVSRNRREISLCGPTARLRHALRAAASRAKACIAMTSMP